MLYRYWYLPMLLIGAIALPSAVPAADDSSEFLDALRNKGMYDLALGYLDYAQDDRLVSEEFKKQIPYQRGVTLLAKWSRIPTAAERDRVAAQARSELNKFAEANPGTPEAADALQQLAGLLTVTATRAMTALDAKPTPPSDAPQIKQTARGQLEESRKLLEQVEQSLVEQLGKFPKALDPKTQSAEIDLRRTLRERLARVRVLKSENLLQQANTLDASDGEYKSLLGKAAEEFQALYDKYDGFPVGFEARLNQGECYLKLGEEKKANGCLEDVIVRCEGIAGYRPLVTKALSLQAEQLLAKEELDAVIEKQGAWLATARGGENRRPEWLTLKFQVAEAKRKKAASEGVEDNQKRKLTTEARELYTDLAQLPSKYQLTARQILAQQFQGDDESAERKQVKSFEEALQTAKDAINLMNVAKQTLPAAKANNPDGVAALEQQAESGFKDALYYLEAAQSLVDDDTPVAQINEGRWLRCYLLWQDKQFYQSAVLADFLARRYPEDANAEVAAQLALASYQSLYQQALQSEAEKAGVAEMNKLRETASFITRRWSGTSLANKAFGVLLAFSIRDQQFDTALALVQELPEAQRATFQAKIANAMWETQLRAAIRKDDTIDRSKLKAKAMELLEGSFEQLAADPTATDALAASTLYLAQARLENGDYTEAIALLEDPKTGAIALSKTNNPIASRQAYAMEAYKAALRSYVSVVPPQTDKAVAAMADLEQVAGGAGDKLTRVYLGLGIQLQNQIEELQAAGKTEEANRVSDAFVAFLNKLSERGSADPTVQQWMARTYYQLAEGLKNDPTAEEKRSDYYGRAADSFRLLLADPATVPDTNRQLALKLQYAQTLRHSGQFADAMQVFEEILSAKEMMIEAQTAAAYTLQEWGAAGDATKFSDAVARTGPLNDKGKPIIWGWNYLGKVAASVARTRPELSDRFKNLFYECWLNIARVRLLRSESETGSKKADSIKEARKVATTMVRDYPDLLKTPLRPQFDELLKSIQRAEGGRAEGLKELVEDEE